MNKNRIIIATFVISLIVWLGFNYFRSTHPDSEPVFLLAPALICLAVSLFGTSLSIKLISWDTTLGEWFFILGNLLMSVLMGYILFITFL